MKPGEKGFREDGSGRPTLALPRRHISLVVVLVSLAAVAIGWSRWSGSIGEFPWDFAINGSAARVLDRHGSPYNKSLVRAAGVEWAGPGMARGFASPFESYLSPPTTAAVLIPLSRMSFRSASFIYRLLVVLAFVFAVCLSAWTLPPQSRPRGTALGLLFLATAFGAPSSLGAGQLDAFVACAYALALLGLSRRWSPVTGAGVALATLLKVSPVLGLVLMGLRRGRREAGWGFAMLVSAGAGAAVVLPQVTEQFLREVVPALAGGSLGMENQSLTGFVARLIHGPGDFTDFRAPAGMTILCAAAIMAFGVLAIVGAARRRPLGPFELSSAILVALLAGPITWTHYVAWSLVFAVQLGNGALWVSFRARRIAGPLVVAGWILLSMPVYILPSRAEPSRYFTEAFTRAHPLVVLLTGVHTLGVLLWFVASLVMLSPPIRTLRGHEEELAPGGPVVQQPAPL